MNKYLIAPVLERVRKSVRELSPYIAARGDGFVSSDQIFLDANENPWSLSSKVSEINRYPSPQPIEIKKILSRIYGVKENQLLLTRGADESIDLLIRTFCEAGKDSVLILPPTFLMYAVAAKIQGAKAIFVPLKKSEGFSLDLPKIFKALTRPSLKIVFLCSPNAPTGNSFSKEQIEEICQKAYPKIVVIDEAYLEFSGRQSFTSLIKKYPNVVIFRTLSKAYGMAGARLGSTIAHSELIQQIRKVLPIYPIPVPSVDVALEVLSPEHSSQIEKNIEILKLERERVFQALEQSLVFRNVYPSETNFIFVETADSKKVVEWFRKKGVWLRDQHGQIGSENSVRITIGSHEQNDLLLKLLKEFSSQKDKRKAPQARKAESRGKPLKAEK